MKYIQNQKENSFYDCVVPGLEEKTQHLLPLKWKFEFGLNPQFTFHHFDK